MLSPPDVALSLAAEVFAKRDFGFALLEKEMLTCVTRRRRGMREMWENAYFPTCLFLKALNFAVHGDMIVSEGET